MTAYEEMGSKWARIAKAVPSRNGGTACSGGLKWDIARPSYADEETKEEERQAISSTAGRPEEAIERVN